MQSTGVLSCDVPRTDHPVAPSAQPPLLFKERGFRLTPILPDPYQVFRIRMSTANPRLSKGNQCQEDCGTTKKGDWFRVSHATNVPFLPNHRT